MTPERWSRVKRILDDLEDCPPGERETRIAAACQGDDELRREVESLLSFEEKAELLERPDRPAAPAHIGPWRIERLLGSGGMGSVFLASRDDAQYHKRVAIKLIQWTGDPETARRFRTERQVLANLDHPNIARLLDGGALPDGQPYIVMEYIDGQPVDKYARGRGLEIDGVLTLFLRVCAAVQFAHRNLVVHRDIKAGNILVTEDGEPHLLDFGIARLLNPDAPDLDRTQPWQRLLTPGSASPEQAAGGVVTTASDVYSLGVLLYSLLSGASFYAGAKDFATDPGRAIREYEPPPVSETAGLAPRIRRLLAGDLDNIVRKATAKDPAGRYATVDELASDVRRHLEGHPVAARPASLFYRARKFARRNRVFVAASALVLLTIAAGTAASGWYAYRAHLAEANAERRFEALHRLTNSMLFEVDDAVATLQGATAARAAIVNRTLEYLDQMASDAGENPAVLRDLATAYVRIGRIQSAEQTAHLGGAGTVEKARRSFEKARDIRARLSARDPGNAALRIETLATSWEIAESYRYEGDLERARAIESAAASEFAALGDRLGSVGRDYTETRYQLGSMLTALGQIAWLEGDTDGSLVSLRRALAVRSALLAAQPGDARARRVVGIAHNYLSMGLEAAGRFSEAAAQERLALETWEPMADASPRNVEIHGMVADANQHLCRDLWHMGRLAEALARCRNSLDLYQAAETADPDNVQAKEDLATAFSAQADLSDRIGKPREALVWESKARALYAVVEAKDPDSLETATNDAASLLHFGQLELKSGAPESARRDIAAARAMLEKQTRQSPENRRIRDLCDKARRSTLD